MDNLCVVYRPAKGPGITKFGHRWRGPGKIVEAAGYDNYLVQMLESGHELVIHCSFLLSYYYPTHLLEEMAEDMAINLRDEAIAAADENSEEEGSSGTRIRQEETSIDRRRPTDVNRTPVAAIVDSPVGTRDPYGTERKSESDDEPEGIGGQQEPDGEPEPATADGRWQREHENRRVGPEERDGNIASRTRSKIRRAPYRGTEREDAAIREQEVSGGTGTSKTRTVPVGSESQSGTGYGRGGEGSKQTAREPGSKAVSGGHVRRREQHELEELERELRRIAHEENEEPRVYIFANRGRRGVDSLVSTHSRLARIGPTDTVVERRRRRYRCRTGRYVLEFEVERLGDRHDGGRPERLWINFKDFEHLWREGRLRSERDDDRGGQKDRSVATTRDSSRTAATD
ncbi:hypothetical protein GN244_ATG10075 [Phytophthora infestans]|uniref:Uncharacterized protein n=1 Tax=Phytophthora infestans TaxID=4787 RepID=A0A833T5I3_PHYIN|nr:hypothetical protein GN244_ATG10075 [Phytophthora infestans]